ncbi:MAG: NAD(P)H-hydrate dehydratase [Lachnospiraceae bacterium]|nr:NAD(P)H-hydrate dehydratase [Lachnospiraceae bacterium]
MDTVREAVKSTMEWSDVIVLGPGLGTDEVSEYIVEKVVRQFSKTIILDADALNVLSANKEWLDEVDAKIIITPHLLEMSRLTGVKKGEIKENKYDMARDFAKEHGVVVVLKDSRTIVSDGGKQAYINMTGNNGMATGGSGDVLSGIIAGLCGQNMEVFEAAKLGVYMHGMAGQEAAISKGRYSMIASDIVRSITRVLEGDYYVN